MSDNRRLIGVTTRVGDLYYFNCRPGFKNSHTAADKSPETKEDVWHGRFDHLGARNLQKLAKYKWVEGYAAKEITFCKSYGEEKHHRGHFPTSGGKRAKEPLGLVHSDLCGKMNSVTEQS